MADYTLEPGAHADPAGTTFVVCATRAKEVAVRIYDATRELQRSVPLVRNGPRFKAHVEGVGPGALYQFVLDGDELPDPHARFLPFGVDGPARVVAAESEPALASPPPLHRWSIYELHVGTFTEEGTYDAAAAKLDHLVELGVTAVELLPIAAFGGHHGWGYDGVALFAPHAPYGEPASLRAFVRAAHARGLAVVLDVVYNHFGPAGNYLSRYAPEYFTPKVQTPWGAAPDYTWEPMRRLVLDNVRYWLDEFGFDGLRLDATHAIHDTSSAHILTEITALARARGRRVFFEDERNEPAVVLEHGADGVWADDFHHQVHVLLTGERDGYYAAHEPTVSALAECIRSGWVYAGQPYPPWEGRPRGKPADALTPEQMVTCIQNHDQVGNRALGTRLSAEVDADRYIAAAVLHLFLPSIPLLFMGQEWAASSPFLYFSDHEGELGRLVSEGRRKELASFAAFARVEVPDPQARASFEQSRLRWEERSAPLHARVHEAHRTMLRLRRDDAVLGAPCGDHGLEVVSAGDDLLVVTRRAGAERRTLVTNFGDAAVDVPLLAEGTVMFASGAVHGIQLGAGGVVVLR